MARQFHPIARVLCRYSPDLWPPSRPSHVQPALACAHSLTSLPVWRTMQQTLRSTPLDSAPPQTHNHFACPSLHVLTQNLTSYTSLRATSSILLATFPGLGLRALVGGFQSACAVVPTHCHVPHQMSRCLRPYTVTHHISRHHVPPDVPTQSLATSHVNLHACPHMTDAVALGG